MMLGEVCEVLSIAALPSNAQRLAPISKRVKKLSKIRLCEGHHIAK
jgi:hypothetical protein